MEYSMSKHYYQRTNYLMRELRMQNKLIENAVKPLLASKDVLKTSDFTFSKNVGIERIGDSGELLLAKNKTNKLERYIVKHQYTDCACNEFVYYKLADFLDIKTPVVKLFEIVANEKRKYFKTEFIAGIEYLNIVQEKFSIENKEQAKNWKDYFKFKALYDIFDESDSFEVVLDDQDYIYKIDNTAAFTISEHLLSYAGIDFSYDDFVDIKKNIRNQIMRSLNYDRPTLFLKNYEMICNKYGKEYARYYLEPFSKIQEISEDYVDGFVNTLCYFYADMVGDYYKEYIKICKNKCYKFLKDLT